MKQQPNFILATVLLAGLTTFLSCKKNDKNTGPSHSASFVEEFKSVPGLNAKGWVLVNNTMPLADYGAWKQGPAFVGKGPVDLMTAYSYTNSTSEFAYATGLNNYNTYDISSWLITPELTVRNGDKISFFTSTLDAFNVNYRDRLQVLLNPAGTTDVGNTETSVGGFTTTLIDINPGNTAGGYPKTWTPYSHTFSGISGTQRIRIGFRYLVPKADSANQIGIDQFRFEGK